MQNASNTKVVRLYTSGSSIGTASHVEEDRTEAAKSQESRPGLRLVDSASEDQQIFDGLQAGERVLYVIEPHPLQSANRIAVILIIAAALYRAILWAASAYPELEQLYSLELRGIGIVAAFVFLGLWWNSAVTKRIRAYITDRRIVRFGFVFPFFTVKRALFWNEVLKAKAAPPNIIYRILGICTLKIRPEGTDEEDISIPYSTYGEDLVNYLDKILYYFKNKPEEMSTLRPFVAAPKGNRY